MEEGKLSKSTSNLTNEADFVEKSDFRKKVKKMQVDTAIGKIMASAGEERFNRVKKEKMQAHMGYKASKLEV